MKLVQCSYARKTFTRLLTVLTGSRPSNCTSCGEGLLLTPKYLFNKPLGGYAPNICQPLTVDTSHGVWSCSRRSFSSVRTNLQENNKPRVSPQEEIVSSVVEEDKPLSCDEWACARNEVLSARGPFNVNSIDAFIMHSCCKEIRFQVGLSFMKYLQQQGKGPNVATVGLFMKLFNQCFWDRKVDPELSALVLSLYDSMRQKCPLLDCSTAERAIQGLALTSRWKEGYELLEMAKLTDWPRSAAYTALACAAFNNGEGEKGWRVLAELFQRVDRKPGPEAYLTWLRNGGSVFTVLEFLEEHGQVISAEVAEQLRRSAESTKLWRGKMAVISDSGVCSSCRSQVTSPNLTQEEFGRLKSAILDRVLIGDNVYLKTTPAEVKSFLNFLSRCQKYDIVLDGLNIAMAATNSSSARTSSSPLSALLKDTVYHFTRRGLRVLVLGRKHMGKWNRKHMDFITRNAQTFLAENLTQDDPLLLLAAINSGLGTKIVSRDLLRSHTFLLKEPDLQRLFRRWQYNHQCTYFIKNGKISIVDPPQLCPEVQKSSETSWHVPYEEKMVVLPPSLPLKVPENWLCLVKNKIIK